MRPLPDFPTTYAEDCQNAAAQAEQVRILREGLAVCTSCPMTGAARYRCATCGDDVPVSELSSAEQERFARLSAAIAAYSHQTVELEALEPKGNLLVGVCNALTLTVLLGAALYCIGWLVVKGWQACAL
jgi:hypothetical protein